MSLLSVPARCITIDLDYTYDTNGFFTTNPDAKQTLEFAAKAFEPLMDNLLAIQPSGGDTWTARFTNPGTGFLQTLDNLSVSADAVLIFAGARDIGDGDRQDINTIGLGGPGLWNPINDPTFENTVQNRGQGITEDPGANDFGPWGGSIAFDTVTASGQPRSWHFDVDTAPELGTTDFLSVAMHELTHLLGFGTSDSFGNRITGVTFHGPAVTALTGASVDVSSDHGHWDFGTTSPPYAGVEPQAALNPSISPGSRRVLTPLDYAGLKDIGWEVPDQLLGLPGDLDADLDVDGSDFLRWQRGYGLSFGATAATGDADGDGEVDSYDKWIVLRNLGEQGVATFVPSAVTIPEPSSCTLLLVSVMLQLPIHRRRRREPFALVPTMTGRS